MTLGECINNYLDEHDMSMRKFAALAGVSHAYISNIVNGKTSRGNDPIPTLKVYKGIAKAMGIEVNELLSTIDGKITFGELKKLATFSDEEMDEESQARLQECNDIFKSYSPEKQELALKILKSLT